MRYAQKSHLVSCDVRPGGAGRGRAGRGLAGGCAGGGGKQALEIEVVHDIPVKVMPANEAEYYLPPKVHSPQVRRTERGVVHNKQGMILL